LGRRKFSLEEVKDICLSFGWTLLSKEYINVRGNLEIMCARGHVSFKSLEKIKEGRGCKDCRNEDQRVDFEVVKEKFAELGLTLITDKYKGAHSPMLVFCENGHVSMKNWHGVRKGQGCNECGYDTIKGENHYNYNHELTEDERKDREQSLYNEWRKSVYERDGYRCVCCDSNRNLHAHHIYSYHSHPELRVDIDNGITLCKDCHYEFHKQFGFKNSTKEQLEEFLQSKNI